jgi:hypothetical protein
MQAQKQPAVELPPGLLEAIAALPLQREVSHCGTTFTISPFELYATCPQCGKRIKVRAFSAGSEIEDVFDAVFAWMLQPGGRELACRRQQVIAADKE